MSVAPAPALEERLTALAPRVRALRVARGATRLVVTALGAVCAVLLLDAALALPAWARGLFLSVWVTAVGVLVWRWVIVPWRAEVAPAEVATELGKKLPELGERLRAVVDAPPGQPDALRAALRDDAARRARAVDFARALPVKPALAAYAALALLALGATFALVAGAGERVRRVAMPWHKPGAAPFRVVTSGEQVVRRGAPVTLTAHTEGASAAPTSATLATRTGPGDAETREPMTADGAGAFHITLPAVPADFEYRVEIGPAHSDWARVSALDPVELAPDTRVEIANPAYIDGRTRVSPVFEDIAGDEFGTVRFHLKFTRPAATVHLDWRAADAPKSELLPVEVAADGMSARAALTLRASGVLKLVLVREADGKKLRTEAAAKVTVVRDEPPRFGTVFGLVSRPRTARPGTKVPVVLEASDDHGVSAAVLVYTLNGGAPVTVPIPLEGGGDTPAAGKLDFNLTGKEGDTFRFRVVVSDNRAVVGENPVGPQTATFPATGWSEVKIVATAPPLELQDIACQGDAFRDALAAGARAAKEVAEDVAAVRAATAGTGLALDHRARLHAAAEKLSAATAEVRAGCREAAIGFHLRALAGEARAVTDRRFDPAEGLLRGAEALDPTARAEALDTATAHLAEAQTALADLTARGAKFARERLDAAALRGLARDQRALASNPGAPDALARQNELLARLAAVVADSDPLRLGTGAAKGEEVRRAAGALADLAARLNELDAAAKLTAADARDAVVAALARDQDALARRAALAFVSLDTPARLAGVAVPKPDEFLRVADLAAAGKTVEALAELEKHAQALERIAAAFEKWATERADPKLAARQFAQWQDDLLARLRAATKAVPFAKLPAAARAAFRAEQAAVRAAADDLVLPPEAATHRANVVIHTKVAADALAADGAGAERAMALATDALLRLADRTPAAGARLTAALREFEKLRQELDTTGNTVDQILRAGGNLAPDALAKRLQPLAERQRKLIAAVGGLDLPGLDPRKARVVSVLGLAVADLRDGTALDVQASQAWAKREFERLKLVLEGNSAPDAKASELHRKMASLADALDALGPNLTPKLLEPGGAVVQVANRELALVAAPEAAALLGDARVALQLAEVGFRDSKPDEVRRRVRAAADALGRLADRLNGLETDHGRVQRLAALRWRGAEKPKDLLFSDEAVRQLAREADELQHTRAGPGGQALKRRALELYARLRARVDPDRIGTDQKALATTLDELAAKTADVAELAVASDRAAPAGAPTAADAFLPARAHAEALRDLAARQRALHAHVSKLATDLAGRLRPAARNPFAPLVPKQRALATDALALAQQFPTDAALKAANAALLAADRAEVGSARAAKEAGDRAAAGFRQLVAPGNGALARRGADLAARQDGICAELEPLLDVPGAAAAQQVARATELAGDLGAYATLLDGAARSFGLLDPTYKALTGAAGTARGAEKRLTEAAQKATEGTADEAEKLRAAADALVRDAARAVESVVPPPPAPGADVARGLALRKAEAAMRAAAQALANGGDPAAARKAMSDAVELLGK